MVINTAESTNKDRNNLDTAEHNSARNRLVSSEILDTANLKSSKGLSNKCSIDSLKNTKSTLGEHNINNEIDGQYEQFSGSCSTSLVRSEAADVFSSEILSLESQIESERIDIDKLDWDSLEDSGNPRNWSNWRKWYITSSAALICLSVTLGSSLYVSGVPELMKAFGSSQVLCVSGLTFYLIGLAFGPAVAGPLSEIIGRKWIYIVSFPASMLLTMGIGLCQNMYSILILRFFCGFFASPALAVAGGSISDLWDLSEIGTAMACFCLAPFLGPVLGSVIGGFAAEHKGWRWTMWASLMISGAILPFVLCLPETYKPIILTRRAEKRGIKLNKPKFDKQYFIEMAKTTLLRPVEMLIEEPIVSVFSIYISFTFAVLFGFFEAYPVIFQELYHMDLGVAGLPFLGSGVGLVCGVSLFVYMDKFVYYPMNPNGTRGNRDNEGNLILSPPETQLLPAKIGAVCLPISLFWLGWTGRTGHVHWMAPIAAGVPFGFGIISIFITVIVYFSMSFPPRSVASAIAANNLLRYLVASVFPLFVAQMYRKLNNGWASSLFGFIALIMVPVPFLFEKYGATLRAKSKYGYAAQMAHFTQNETPNPIPATHNSMMGPESDTEFKA